MRDIKIAYNELNDFLNNNFEKTLLINGIADVEKHKILLNSLNKLGETKGLLNFINTHKNDRDSFFHIADLNQIKLSNRNKEFVKIRNTTIYIGSGDLESLNRYKNHIFDYIIIWPIQSIDKDIKKINALEKISIQQSSKKIIYVSYYEPWTSTEIIESICDRVITLDCKNDNPEEYNRIIHSYNNYKIKEEVRKNIR